MKISRTTSYALHGLCHLAQQGDGKMLASHVIAEARGVPERFLLKILKPLADARILHSTKGPNGGYRLAKPAKAITLLDVVEAVEGTIRGEAPEVGPDGGKLSKRLQVFCDAEAKALRQQLGEVTLAELAKK